MSNTLIDFIFQYGVIIYIGGSALGGPALYLCMTFLDLFSANKKPQRRFRNLSAKSI